MNKFLEITNKVLKIFDFEVKKVEKETHLPYIQFLVGGDEVQERVIEYGNSYDGRFYVKTDSNRNIYIADENTQNMIRYSDEEYIVNLGGELEEEGSVDLVESLNKNSDIA